MAQHQKRLSIILGDNVSEKKTKEELLVELEEMEVKLNQAGVVGLELYHENELLHGKSSEMIEQLHHDEELIEMLRAEVTQSNFERDRIKAAIVDYVDKLKSADMDHRALTEKISYQEKTIKDMTTSRDSLAKKVRSLEQTLQHVHETYGEKHDEGPTISNKQAERELEKIEKEKRSLMMKELIYAQKERMYKYELQLLRKDLDAAVNDKNNSDKSAIILRERSETLSHKFHASLDEKQQLQTKNVQLVSENFRLKNELTEIKALHEEHKSNSPKHPKHRNSIFDHAPRSVMPRTNTLLNLYTMAEEEEDQDDMEQKMKEIEKQHTANILNSKKRHLDHLHSKSQLHMETESDKKHHENLNDRINEVNHQLKENDFTVVNDDDYNDDDVDNINNKKVDVNDGIKSFFKQLSMRNLNINNKAENRFINSNNNDDVVAVNNALLEDARKDIEVLKKTLEMKNKEVNSLNNSKATLNSLLIEAQDDTVEMENDLRFTMRELENNKEVNRTLEIKNKELNDKLIKIQEKYTLLKEKEAISNGTFESSKITINALNEELKTYKLTADKLSKDNEASKLIGDKMMQLQADIIVLQEQKAQEVDANKKLVIKVNQLRETLSKLDNQINNLTQEVNELKMDNAKLGNLIVEKDKLLDAANISKLKEKQNNTEQLNTIKIALNNKKKELHVYQESVVKLKNHYNESVDQIESYKSKLLAQQNETQNHLQTIKELNISIKDQNLKLEARKKSIARMTNELSGIRKDNDALREKYEANMELYNAQILNSLKKKLVDADTAVVKYEELKIKFAANEEHSKVLELKLRGSDAKNKDLEKEINSIEKNVGRSEADAAKNNTLNLELEKRIEILEEKRQNLKKLIEEKNSKLQMYKEESIEEAQALTKALDDFKIIKKENNELKALATKLEKYANEQKLQIVKLTNENQNTNELHHNIEMMEHEVEHLTEEVKSLKDELKNTKDTMAKEVDIFSRKEAKTKLFLKNTEESLENAGKKLTDALNQKGALEQRFESMKVEYAQIEIQNKNLKSRDRKTSESYEAKINNLKKELTNSKQQTFKILSLYNALEKKFNENETKLKNYNIIVDNNRNDASKLSSSTEGTVNSTSANIIDDIGAPVDDDGDYDAWADEIDDDSKKQKQVDNSEKEKLDNLEISLTRKLELKRSKVLKGLDIICRGVGVDTLKNTLVGDKIKSIIEQYNIMKKKILLRHKSSIIELKALNNASDRITLLENLIAKETDDLERCIWLIEHLASPKQGAKNDNTFRQNILSIPNRKAANGKTGKIPQKKRRKKKVGYDFRHLNEAHDHL
jgi:chromosome segregation ATPase